MTTSASGPGPGPDAVRVEAGRLPEGRPVVVWGNCQAAPLAQLITPAVAGAGAVVVPTPPVFEVAEDELARVHELVRSAAALVTQPVRDEYRWPGCGANDLAALLPPDARCVRIPVVYDIGPFPYQCNAHGEDGVRVDAPVTDYHDLRVVVAAERGYDLAETLAWWPTPAADAVRAIAADSQAELTRRDALVDVPGADLLGPGAMFTLSHPSNATLAGVAGRILDRLGLDASVEHPLQTPSREFLGERRAPVEPAVVAALGWPESVTTDCWQIRGEDVATADIVEAQLAFYAVRPDVVADTRRRQAGRLARLGL